MMISKQISDAKFMMTKDELGYGEVLDDFENASYIYILTYNISRLNDGLLIRLNECCEKEVCIISNLPGRWERYFNDSYAREAKKHIQLYKTRLDIQEINSYFCFSNHAKIIMTDNIVYVGSSNYSEESANNFEAGFISRDVEFISFLHNKVFPWIIDSSVELKTDDELLFLETALKQAIAAFQVLYEDTQYAFYTYPGHSTQSEIQIYRGYGVELNKNDLAQITQTIENYLEILQRANKIFSLPVFFENGISNLYDKSQRVEEIQDMIDGLFETTLSELAYFDEQKYANDYLEEKYVEAYDEYLNTYAQKAINDASSVYEALAETAKEDADSLLEQLKELETISEDVFIRFKQLPLNLIRIDNSHC